MLKMTVALVTAAAVTVGCAIPQPCTDLFAYGLTVTVVDADGTPICDATVSATDEEYQETLEPQAGTPCTYVGAGERAGTYRVEASKDGFGTAIADSVVVGADECHVIGQPLTLTLEPATP